MFDASCVLFHVLSFFIFYVFYSVFFVHVSIQFTCTCTCKLPNKELLLLSPPGPGHHVGILELVPSICPSVPRHISETVESNSFISDMSMAYDLEMMPVFSKSRKNINFADFEPFFVFENILFFTIVSMYHVRFQKSSN